MLSKIKKWRPIPFGAWEWPSWRRWTRRKEPADELTRLIKETKLAWSDYEAAHVYFNYVKDPELIDHSIYRLEAAGKRFSYLWNQLRALRKQKAGSATTCDSPHTSN